ncbi:MAG: (2Fe-2S)-binding protein [Deltaproteobacteria bacterium]|nr:(2Fe-2S)-binding protein [Deltaproteobacteria bacterium]
MSDTFRFTIDGVEVTGTPGQTILQAAEAAGIWIPRLCYLEGLVPGGACRVCTVKVQGRFQAACAFPAGPGLVVENDTEEIRELRKQVVEMLFVEGNHFCMFCEKSGNCELQALAYRLGIASPRYPYLFPVRQVDASHPDVFIDGNRCIQCGRCIRASRDVDGKGVFGFVERSRDTRVGVDARTGLGGTSLTLDDRAVTVCPVGAILKKRVGFAVPIGERLYDHRPIGTDLERRGA